jgi:hypothetical protein
MKKIALLAVLLFGPAAFASPTPTVFVVNADFSCTAVLYCAGEIPEPLHGSFTIEGSSVEFWDFWGGTDEGYDWSIEYQFPSAASLNGNTLTLAGDAPAFDEYGDLPGDTYNLVSLTFSSLPGTLISGSVAGCIVTQIRQTICYPTWTLTSGSIVAAPEPMSIILALTGIAGIATRKRARAKAICT